MKSRLSPLSLLGRVPVGSLAFGVAQPAFWLLGLRLTALLRRYLRAHPGTLRRMGRHGRDGYVLRPKGWPVLFRLQLDPGAAEVGVFPASATPACQAEIEARLTVLIAIAEGKLDADSAFFSRNVTIRGNTGSVMALHNTLEASELDIAAFLGLPATAQSGFRTLLGLLKSDIYEPVAHV